MGHKALEVQRITERKIRHRPITEDERTFLQENARYEGSPAHKRNPGDFGLGTPHPPRPDRTLCDEAGIFQSSAAMDLFSNGITAGLVSEGTTAGGFPKQIWVVDQNGQVFEAMYGGSQVGRYHGYPIRRSDPLFDQVISEWKKRGCGSSTST